MPTKPFYGKTWTEDRNAADRRDSAKRAGRNPVGWPKDAIESPGRAAKKSRRELFSLAILADPPPGCPSWGIIKRTIRQIEVIDLLSTTPHHFIIEEL
jgi:hypothetical protein